MLIKVYVTVVYFLWEIYIYIVYQWRSKGRSAPGSKINLLESMIIDLYYDKRYYDKK